MKATVYNPKYIFWAKVVSFLLSPFYFVLNCIRPSFYFDQKKIKSILVCEYHRIGDVLLIIPVLHLLRKHYPKAKITLLCCSSAKLLAVDLKVVDEVIEIDVPWTTWSFSPFKWIRARSYARTLKKKNFDLVIDFKGDLRNSWFLWHIKAKKSLGYTDTGGSMFYTHPINPPYGIHQSSRALALISHLGLDTQYSPDKKIYFHHHGSIVLHPGGSDPKRMWPKEKWVKLTELLSKEHTLTMVKTPDSNAVVKQIIEKKLNVDFFEDNLVQFKDWLGGQKLLVCIDSMPGHLGAYLGIPTVSIFGSQDPKITRPLGPLVKIVTPDFPCNHERSHWRLCNFCMETITVDQVFKAIETLMYRAVSNQ